MDATNRVEAVRCFQFAKKCLDDGDRVKCVRLLEKSRHLCPTEECQKLLKELKEGENDRFDDGQHSRDERRRGEASRQRGEARSNTENKCDRDFTEEQVELVKSMNDCKDYYKVLGVSKDVSDLDLKKQYRKLALRLHPDKNKAPGASDAFKVVGTAYAVLSDKEKRRQYDLWGPEDSQSRSNYHTRHYYQGDFDAEEIFNRFFGRRAYSTDLFAGSWSTTSNRYEDVGNEMTAEYFSRVLPLLAILLMTMIATAITVLYQENPPFSLHRTRSYHDVRDTQTRPHVIRYYVQSDFSEKYAKSLPKLEADVEREYISYLRQSCFLEKQQRNEQMMWARYHQDKRAYVRASEMPLPNCEQLHVFVNG
ncbi:dnaJ homolog subfamily B member 12-like [Corticium candelabrum]|uniref:dnaJ homolog subfamily B member 12-like n=1 Tax=Corticium candelabrum TaxID=121492 RepID=UPI002E26FA96|nr:dnaJ homolog subfamily B member 12-like [Corticium candelabrum]